MAPYLNVGLLILLFAIGCFVLLLLVLYTVGTLRGFQASKRMENERLKRRGEALGDAYRQGQQIANDTPEGAMMRFTRSLFSRFSH